LGWSNFLPLVAIVDAPGMDWARRARRAKVYQPGA